ncbi:plasmid mobilization protein [Eggerthellaceae bacterium PR-HUZ602407-17]
MDCLKPKYADIHFRVPVDVKAYIQTLAEKSNLTLTDYAIWSMMNGDKPIYTIDKNVLMDIQLELARQGNNLNQIAHALNYIISRTLPAPEQELAIETVLGEINSEHENFSKAARAVMDLQQKVYKTTLLSVKT